MLSRACRSAPVTPDSSVPSPAAHVGARAHLHALLTRRVLLRRDPATARHKDSPWPSPAHRRRSLCDHRLASVTATLLHLNHGSSTSCESVEAGADGQRDTCVTSASSSLTNVSTISSSYVCDELTALVDSSSSASPCCSDSEDTREHDLITTSQHNNCHHASPAPDQHGLVQVQCGAERGVYLSTLSMRQSAAAAASSLHSLMMLSASPVSCSRHVQHHHQHSSSSLLPPAVVVAAGGDDDVDDDVDDDDEGAVPCLEDLRQYANYCATCGVNWSHQETSLSCSECGGYPLNRPCPVCSGVCGSTWTRDVSSSHDKAVACWSGACCLTSRHHCAPLGVNT